MDNKLIEPKLKILDSLVEFCEDAEKETLVREKTLKDAEEAMDNFLQNHDSNDTDYVNKLKDVMSHYYMMLNAYEIAKSRSLDAGHYVSIQAQNIEMFRSIQALNERLDNNTPETIETDNIALFHRDQYLLLEQLGIIDYLKEKGITNNKLAVLIGHIVNKTPERSYLTYIKKGVQIPEGSKKKNCRTEDSLKKVEAVLRFAGLDEIADETFDEYRDLIKKQQL